MILNFQLTEADFFTYQLYIASESDIVAKKRRRTRFMIPILYIGLAIYIMVAANHWVGSLAMLVVAVLWWFFYPLYSAVRYRKHFDKFIKKNYKNRFNRDIEVVFQPEEITMRDSGTTSSIKTTETENLVELPDHFFVKLVTGAAIIIPKHAVLDPVVFKTTLEKYGIPYLDQMNWKWK